MSGVVAETLMLLSSSSYGNQIMNISKHTITKNLSDEKNHKAINEPMFKILNTVEETCMRWSYGNQPLSTDNPSLLAFSYFIQYAKLRMLELYYNLFDNFCDKNKFEKLEMDTDSLNLALAEENLTVSNHKNRNIWEK